MATVPIKKPQSRAGVGAGGGGPRNSADVGRDVVVDLARQDARWFSWVGIFFAVVICFLLPVVFLMGVAVKDMIVENLVLQADNRRTQKQLRELQRELRKEITHDRKQETTDPQ